MAVIAVDYETYYSKKLKYGLKTMLAETYVQHELFHPYLIAVCDGTTSWAGNPREFNWNSLDGQTLLSHNKYFDCTVQNEIIRRGWAPKVVPKAWHCTANMTAYLCNRRALDNAVEFLFGVKMDKSSRTEADGKRWPEDFSEEERAKMMKYAPADAVWCWRLWDKYNAQWPELEQRLSNQTIEQGMCGVQINAELLNDYLIKTHAMKLKTEKLMPWMADDDTTWSEFDISPTATKCIAEQCRRVGIPCPPVKAHEGEEAFQEWETLYREKNPWIVGLSSWRSVNKLYKTFMLMKSRLRSDNTMPFSLKYFGAHTGRWSGDGRINFQNPRKKPVLCNEAGLMESSEARIDAALKEKDVTGKLPEWVKYPIDFRALIIPRPGKKMITCDLAQIEPRILAWLCGNKVLLGLMRDGMSVYEAFARTNLGYTGAKMDKSSDYYKMIKIQVLGLGYQAGWEKFITMALDGGVDITANDPEWIDVTNPHTGETKKVSGYGTESRKIVAAFREANKPMTALWAKLDDSFKQSIGRHFTMSLPNGRKMNYRDVRAAVKIVVDKETGKAKRTTVFTAESDGRRKDWYGGKLTENLVQATARDVFAGHLIALDEAPGIRVLFSCHDEAICEVDPGVSADEVEKIMSVAPDWLPGCPIGAEAKEVAHYQK
jgi:hypothetical protein